MTEFFNIGNITVSVSDYHHEVLHHWSRIKQVAPERDLRVITLDHHTDVVAAFRGSQPVFPEAWRSSERVAEAVRLLKHDEHIDWAVQTGLIKSAVVAAHVNLTPPASDKIKVVCDSSFPDEMTQLNSPEQFRPLADKILEDDFLAAQLTGVDIEKDFILDIDCDNFFSRKSLVPEHHSVFDTLIKNCCGVSISRESDYVRILQFSGEKLTGEDIANHLVQYIQTLLA